MTEIQRGYFQCPDSGDAVVVMVPPAPRRASAQPDGEPRDAETLDWCRRFDDCGLEGLAAVRCALGGLGVDARYDVNWA